MASNTTGYYNCAFGMYALNTQTTGWYNVGVGYEALAYTTTGANNVGIGKNALRLNTTAAGNTAVGTGSLEANTTGAYNTSLGFTAGDTTTTGSFNTLIGGSCDSSSATTDNSNGLGYAISAVSGYTTIGIGTSDIRAEHGVATWATVSDERVKKDIEDSTVGLNFINDLRPVTFNYRNKGDLPTEFNGYEEDSTEVYKSEKSQHGFIAQEVKAAIDKHSDIKDGFSMWDDDDDTGQQRVGETALIPMLTKAVQELSAEVQELKKQLENK